MPNSYIPPNEVISPKRQWTLVSVLYDWGKNKAAIALGCWDRNPVLALRWNGNGENPIGNPQSRGLPTWFIVPDEFRDSVLYSVRNIVPEKVERAHEFILEAVVQTNTIADPKDRKSIQEAVFKEIGTSGLTAKIFEDQNSSEYVIRIQSADGFLWKQDFFGPEQTTAHIREEVRKALAQYKSESQK